MSVEWHCPEPSTTTLAKGSGRPARGGEDTTQLEIILKLKINLKFPDQLKQFYTFRRLKSFFLLQFLMVYLYLMTFSLTHSVTHTDTHTPQYGSELTRSMNICSAPGRWNGWNGYHRNHLSEQKPLTCSFTMTARAKHTQTRFMRRSYMLIIKWTQQFVYFMRNCHHVQLLVTATMVIFS